MKTARAVAIPLLLQLALGGAARVTLPVAQAEEYPVPPPPLSDGIFPCSDCHADLEPDPTPRVLGMHRRSWSASTTPKRSAGAWTATIPPIGTSCGWPTES